MSIKYDKCPVPDCERRIIQGHSSNGLCTHHEELLTFLLFILPHIKEGQKVTNKHGLVLPGQSGYSIPKGAFK